MSIFLAIALHVLAVQPPRNDAKCYNAVRRLGTDNIPLDDSFAHSIVNVWPFLESGRQEPIAFLYKNHAGDYYFEFTKSVSEQRALSWGIPKRFFARQHSGINFDPAKASVGDIVQIEQALLAHGAVLAGCFTSDLHPSH